MKRRTGRKLKVARESLRNITPEELGQAKGGTDPRASPTLGCGGPGDPEQTAGCEQPAAPRAPRSGDSCNSCGCYGGRYGC